MVSRLPYFFRLRYDRFALLRSNIVKIYLLNFFWMFLVAIPIIVPYWQSLGLTMQEIYSLQAVFAFQVVIYEVPSGYLSDLLGRKKTLVTASLFNGIAVFILASSQSFWGFVVFETFAAIAISLLSGSDIALLYDSLEESNEKEAVSSSFLGKRVFFSQLGETLAAILAGFLVSISLKTPLIVYAFTAWTPFFIALTLHEPPRKKLETRRHLDNFFYIYKNLFRSSRILTLTLLNNIFYGTGTLLAVWAFQDYWKSQNIPISWFGWLWASYNLTVAIAARNASWIEQKLGTRFVLISIGVLPILGYLGMGWTGSLTGVIMGLTFQIGRGLNQVILRDALNTRIESKMRATANSVASLGTRFLFCALGPLLGYLIDQKGHTYSFQMYGWIYCGVFLVLLLPLMKEVQKLSTER